MLVENSIVYYGESLESPALCVLDVDESFVWGDNLVDSRFKSAHQPLFNVDIEMNVNGAYYTTDPDEFAVSDVTT